MEDRELLLHNVVEHAVHSVHHTVWDRFQLTAAESRLAWLRVIAKLLDSVVIDQQSSVVKERLFPDEVRT